MGNRVTKRRWYKELRDIQNDGYRITVKQHFDYAVNSLKAALEAKEENDQTFISRILSVFSPLPHGRPLPDQRALTALHKLNNYVEYLEEELAYTRSELAEQKNNAEQARASKQKYRQLRQTLWESTKAPNGHVS